MVNATHHSVGFPLNVLVAGHMVVARHVTSPMRLGNVLD